MSPVSRALVSRPAATRQDQETGRRARKDGWNLIITTHGGPDTASPIGNVWFNSRCENANIGWACDPELEKLVDAWASELDRAKARSLLDGVQKRAYESLPYVSWGQFTQPVALGFFARSSSRPDSITWRRSPLLR